MSKQVHDHRQLTQFLLVVVFLTIGIYSSNLVDMLRHSVLIAGDRANIGTVARGDVIEHKFTVWNVAPKTITIALAQPSCTCSVANVSRYVLPPFHSSTVCLKVRTLDSASGKQLKGIRLVFKDGKTAFPYIQFFLSDKLKRSNQDDSLSRKRSIR